MEEKAQIDKGAQNFQIIIIISTAISHLYVIDTEILIPKPTAIKVTRISDELSALLYDYIFYIKIS